MANFYKKWINNGYDKDDSDLNNYRKKIINISVLYGIPILTAFIIMNLKAGKDFLAYMDIGALIVLLISFVYLHKSKRAFIPSIGTLFAFYLIVIGVLFDGSIANSGFFWFFAFPTLAIYFLGQKRGLKFAYALLVTIFIFYIYAKVVNLELTYDPKLLVILIIALFLVNKITVHSEKLRKHYEQTIIDQKEELERLNKSLEKKVKLEVQKNREKDQQLVHQARLAQMGEMISMIAHQWRQPLSAISSTATSLSVDIAMDNYEKDFFDEQTKKISDYSQHLSSTIDDFRNFFKTDKEKQEITLEEIVDSTLSIIGTSLTNKNISLETSFNCNKKINTHPNELKQVVLNLIKNAEDILLEKDIKNPSIKISTENDGNYCLLKVEDNAGGVPKDIIDKIFDPYFSTKQTKDGTGLGLYMSKTIVEDHCNGILSIQNNQFGAVFTIKIS